MYFCHCLMTPEHSPVRFMTRDNRIHFLFEHAEHHAVEAFELGQFEHVPLEFVVGGGIS